MKGAKDDLASAERAFADALKVAVEAAETDEREKREKRPGGGPGDASKPKPAAPALGLELPSLSRGSFSGANAGQAFAAPGIQSRQLKAAEETNVILKEVVKAVEGNGQKAAVFK